MFIAFSPDDPAGEPFVPSPAERTLLWALRRLMVSGPQHRCGCIVVALDRCFGERGGELLPLLRVLTMALASHAVRPITVAAQCAILVTPDETRLLLALRHPDGRLAQLSPLAGEKAPALVAIIAAMVPLVA